MFSKELEEAAKYSYPYADVDFDNSVLANMDYSKISSILSRNRVLLTCYRNLSRTSQFCCIESKKFLGFHKILSGENIPYLLGVTPFPSKTPLNPKTRNYEVLKADELEILKQVSNPMVEIGMHGITHQTRSTIRLTEIVGLSRENLEKNLLGGLVKLQKEGFKTDVFIPPFNSFDLYSVESLRKYFKVICGGPESVLRVGLRLSPCYLNGALYVPSYFPAYGRAEEILGFVENVKKLRVSDYSLDFALDLGSEKWLCQRKETM